MAGKIRLSIDPPASAFDITSLSYSFSQEDGLELWRFFFEVPFESENLLYAICSPDICRRKK